MFPFGCHFDIAENKRNIIVNTLKTFDIDNLSSFNPSISSTTILIPLVSLLSTTVFRINSISNGLPDTGIVVYSFRSPSTLLHNVCFMDLMPTAERITTDKETSSSGTRTGKSDGSVNIWDGSLVIFLIGITFCAVLSKRPLMLPVSRLLHAY